jgi:hypothetical protein
VSGLDEILGRIIMNGAMKAEASQFLDQVIKLNEEDFQAVRKTALDVGPEAGNDARARTRLDAAGSAWLDKAVRGAIRPLRGIFTKYGGLFSRAITLSIDAAEAIVRRDKLSAEQYEALVGGFRKVGVVIPEQGASQREGS